MLPEVQEVHARGKTQRVFVRPFAWNLHAPTPMEWSPDGRLFVVERTTGKIKDATKGGDLADAPAVVEGLEGPSSMAVLPDGRMRVTEFWGGRIREIREGSAGRDLPVYAGELNRPYSIAVDAVGRLSVLASPDDKSSAVLIVREGGRIETLVPDLPTSEAPGFEGFAPPWSWPDRWHTYVAGCGKWEANPKLYPELPYTLAVSVGGLGLELGVPEEGGRFAELDVLASGLGYTGGMIAHPSNGLLYVTQPARGEVLALREPRNYHFDPPVVRGLPMASCIRFDERGETMFVCSPANGVIGQVEGAVRA